MKARLAVAAAAALILVLAFNLPSGLHDLANPWTWVLPLELLLAAALALLVPRRLRTWTQRALGLVLAVLLTVRLADWLLWLVLGRPIVLVQDLPLALSLIEIGRGSLGSAAPAAATVVVLLPLVIYFVLAMLVLVPLARLRHRSSIGMVVLAVAALGELVRPPAGGAVGPVWPFGRHGFQQLQQQAERTRSAWSAAATWAAARAVDPVAAIPPEERLTRLTDTDVVLLFIESYGRTALESEPFAEPLRDRLADIEAGLGADGLAAAAGWVVSPTVGGQSWLAHSTLASGVRTADQGGYAAYLTRADGDLAHLFAAAGHRTALISPAIVHPFPEAVRLGFARLLFAADLEYEGPRLGWVTMPDQYTLAAMERLVRPERTAGSPPVFVTVALVGSHAPFTPLPPLVADWGLLEKGRIYSELPLRGASPMATWADPAALRRAYTAAIDLSLAAIQGWAHRFLDRRTLVIALGDHEAAALITGRPDARQVPMHVIAGEPTLLEPFLARGFTPGMLPAPEAFPIAMEDFRAFFVSTFSGSPAPAAPHVPREAHAADAQPR